MSGMHGTYRGESGSIEVIPKKVRFVVRSDSFGECWNTHGYIPNSSSRYENKEKYSWHIVRKNMIHMK